MVGIEKITPVYPGQRVNPTNEKQQRKKRQDDKPDRDRGSDQRETDQGKPHVDEYA